MILGAKEPSRSDIQFSDQRIQIGHWMLIGCGYVFFYFFDPWPNLGQIPPKELDYELLPGSVVSIVEPPALSADVARQLHQVAQRCGSGARLKQRRSDTTFEATWVMIFDFFWWTIGCLGRICTIICTYIIDQPCIDIKRYTGSARHQQTIMVS